MFLFSYFISRSFSHLSSSYSLNFSLIKLTDSCRSVSCLVPLIWFSCRCLCYISLRIFIYFSKFCKLLNRMLTYSGDFNLSVRTSVLSETDVSFKLSRCFLLDSPPSSELLLKSQFLHLKKFAISRLILKSITTILL